MSSRELRARAWNRLRSVYWMVFVVSLIVAAVMSSNAAFIGLILTGPALVGFAVYLLDVVENEQSKGDKFELLLAGVKNNFANALVAFILQSIFVFLWSLLFIIPGIIKALAYSQVFYLLAEDPSLSPTEALSKSQDLMRGHKMRLFWLGLSFLGWFLLGILTFGVGLIFVLPYYQTTLAYFYLDVRGEKPKQAELLEDF
jgi:uncharacterized membrane protein